MQRIGRVARLRQGTEEEYEQLHAAVWPDVLEAIRAAGIANYTIFRYGCWLFSYCELPDDVELDRLNREWNRRPECRRWEERMQQLQEPLPESGGDVWWVPLKTVWRLPDGEVRSNDQGI